MWFTVQQWIEILSNSEITIGDDIRVLCAIYSFVNHEANVKEIAKAIGEVSPKNINLWSGRYGKRINSKSKYNLILNKREKNSGEKYWEIHSTGEQRDYFYWKLRPELVAAMERLWLCGENMFPDEILEKENAGYYEGTKKHITVNSYERDASARFECISKYGAICQVCGIDFEAVYGKIGKGFIHVHHKVPLHSIKKEYKVDAINDLVPVCPNCHAMLHKRQEEPFTVEELKAMLKLRF